MEGRGSVIFLLSGGLFRSDQTRSIDLIALLRGVALRGHSLFVVDDPFGTASTESKDFEQWTAELSSNLKREVTWLRERVHRIPPNAVTRGATTVVVVKQVSNQRATARRVVVDLSEAIKIATLPLFVLVENGLSDAAFLRRTLPAPWRKKLKEWESAGTVRFEHAGGIGEMKRLVEHCSIEGATANPLGMGASAWRASHFLLSDRDSEDREGKPSRDARELQRACERAQLQRQLHILLRRDQESYIPVDALRAII